MENFTVQIGLQDPRNGLSFPRKAVKPVSQLLAECSVHISFYKHKILEEII